MIAIFAQITTPGPTVHQRVTVVGELESSES